MYLIIDVYKYACKAGYVLMVRKKMVRMWEIYEGKKRRDGEKVTRGRKKKRKKKKQDEKLKNKKVQQEQAEKDRNRNEFKNPE